jgi:peptide-methionine (S)-S-oxide reductase
MNRTRARVFSRTSLAILMALGVSIGGIAVSTAGEGRPVPAPVVDETSKASGSEVAILAAGCFWGVQGVFQHVAGVTSAVSGYAGGDQKSAQYRVVSGGSTGHAESVRVTFDPSRISYGRILQIYFSVAHDPTQLNRQGPDVGTQYRSTIFPTSAEQERVARAYIAQLNAAHAFPAPIATTIENGKAFYPAEDYHQDFLVRHPYHAYIVINDLPKVEDLKRLYPAVYRDQPVLTAARAEK